MNKSNFEIVEFYIGQALISDNSAKESFKGKYYNELYQARIFETHSETAVVIPYPSDVAILFPSISMALTYIEQNGIPIEDSSDIFYHNRKILADIEKSKAVILNDFSQSLNFEISPSFDPDYLKNFDVAIKKKLENISFDKRLESYWIPLGVFWGECLILSGKFKWVNHTAFHYNPYTVPNIHDLQGEDYGIWMSMRTVLKHLFEGINIDEEILNAIKYKT